MKLRITKAEFDKLSDEMKKEYKVSKDDDSIYVCTPEDYEDPGELRRAKEREKGEATRLKKEKEELQRELDEIKAKDDDTKNDHLKKKQDIDALEKSWKDKNLKVQQEKDGVIGKRDAFIKKKLRDDQAFRLAQKISDKNADLMLPHVLSRIDVDFDGEEPTVRILDSSGKPSALTLSELETELVADKRFAAIIVGSKASGGGASGGNSGGGASGKKPSEYTEAERVELYKTDPVRFKQVFPQHL